MKYPAIYKSVEGSEYLYQNKDSYYCYERQAWDSSEPHHDCHHSDTNITAEYLANTYGEVKSKEHAEFIVKLAEVNGIDFDGEVGINSNYFCFFPSNSKQLTFWRKEKDASKHGSRKQITIPLPPECESVDEWPKFNDTVSLRYRFDSKQVMYTGELLYLSSNHIIIKTENGNDCHCIRGEWDIEKPKTPEQELRDELISDFREVGQSGIVLIGMYDKVVDEFLSKYNVTKKPQ